MKKEITQVFIKQLQDSIAFSKQYETTRESLEKDIQMVIKVMQNYMERA
jgi:hypothetical protein